MKRDSLVADAARGIRTGSDRPSAVDRFLVEKLAESLPGAPVRFVLWDGTSASSASSSDSSSGPIVASVSIRDRSTLVALVRDPDLEFGEAYTEGRLEVRGDLVGFLEAAIRAVSARTERSPRLRLPPLRLPWLRSHALGASRRNARHHYDVGNDFYRLWLDEEMLYTCAYYPTAEASLQEAQIAKMEYVCRKLRLAGGERVVEAGCGWGALALYMARRHGVTVRAYNVSHEQIVWARERARAEGLDGRVEFVEDDYRAIGGGSYDAFVSVGMLEHVGRENLPALGDVVARALAPAGRGLLHFIGRDRHQPLNAWMEKRIFPGAYPPSVSEVLRAVLEPRRLSLLDVENLRLHYARTAGEWLRRFETAAVRVASAFDDRFVRGWRLYLAGTEAAFRAGSLQLFQILFARSGANDVAMTRDSLYGDGL